MSHLTDRLERDLREIAAGADPSPSAWNAIVARLGDDGDSDDALVLPLASDESKRRVWIAVAAAVLVVIAASAVVASRAADDRSIPTDNPEPVTVPALPPGTSGGWWPQSTSSEVQDAQNRADAGDPAYLWQVDAGLAADEPPWSAEIFARFIKEKLGWEESAAGASFAGYVSGDPGGEYDGVVFVRCAPGRTNPLNPLYVDAPAEIRGCAPTIDDFTYETVSINVSQPGRGGPSGVWVVDRWEILPSRPDSLGPLGLVLTDFSQRQVQQAVPPSGDDVADVLDAFLRARVDGQGAEAYLLAAPPDFETVPLLYATTDGAPYERFEIERLQGPVWPNGWFEYEVRLFAESGTVVEQPFHVVSQNGQLGLLYGYSEHSTTENGALVAVPHSELGGTVTFTAPPLVPRGDGVVEMPTATGDGRVLVMADPPADPCGTSSPPADAADAETLARSIAAVPHFEATEPVPVLVAGRNGLQIDVTFGEQSLCTTGWIRNPPAGDPGWRMRLYLVDYPELSASDSAWRPQVLAMAVIAPATDFENVLEHAKPIVESVEFHTG